VPGVGVELFAEHIELRHHGGDGNEQAREPPAGQPTRAVGTIATSEVAAACRQTPMRPCCRGTITWS
jgi:hypothetical protein